MDGQTSSQKLSKHRLASAFLALAAFVLFASSAWAGCETCSEMQRLATDFKAAGSNQALQSQLILKASGVLDKLHADKRKLTSEEAHSVVNLLQLTLIADPGYSLIESQAKILANNKKRLQAELAKLPASDARKLDTAFTIALDQEELVW